MKIFSNPIRLLSGCLLLALAANGLAADDREARLKAAFVLNFAKFVEWPDSQFNAPLDHITFCFIGIERFRNAYLETFENKKVKNLETRVRIIHFNSPLDECAVLFAKDLNQAQLASLQTALAAKPILTIGENDAFMASGGMIRFYAHQGKIRFEINPAAANAAGLTISSKLLNLARIRTEETGEYP